MPQTKIYPRFINPATVKHCEELSSLGNLNKFPSFDKQFGAYFSLCKLCLQLMGYFDFRRFARLPIASYVAYL